jgi:hypothetical protein
VQRFKVQRCRCREGAEVHDRCRGAPVHDRCRGAEVHRFKGAELRCRGVDLQDSEVQICRGTD